METLPGGNGATRVRMAGASQFSGETLEDTSSSGFASHFLKVGQNFDTISGFRRAPWDFRGFPAHLRSIRVRGSPGHFQQPRGTAPPPSSKITGVTVGALLAACEEAASAMSTVAVIPRGPQFIDVRSTYLVANYPRIV